MPNFEARIRTGYQDIGGLVADMNSLGIAADGSSWRNDAPPRVASDPNWPRFRNALQTDVALRPELVLQQQFGFGLSGTIPHLKFTRANNTHLLVDMDGDFGIQKDDYTFSYELEALGPDAADDQVIMGGDELDLFARGTPSTDLGWRTDAVSTFQAGPHISGVVVYVLRAGGLMDRYINGVIDVTGGAAAPITLGDDTLNPVLTIGGDNAGGQFFDGNLRNIRIWDRALQPDEVDFAFQTLGADGTDKSTTGWAPIENRVWDDPTSVPTRVNPSLAAVHRFLVAKIPLGGNALVQLEATINNVIVPDSGLGGDLFSVGLLENPNLAPVFVNPTAPGFSALQSLRLEAEGHYTIEMRRPNGGAIIFHLDVEEVQ